MTVAELLSTKLRVPEPRPNEVMRARLVAPLTEGLRVGRCLTLVSAPPGFGKTTLLREWAANSGRPVAWLALDEGDNDGDRFLRYVLAALVQADGSLETMMPPVASGASPQELLIAVINGLARTGTELLLVLDDYHQITQLALHDALAFLLANRPPGLHIAIGTREDPPLPLARMRARDQVTEVRERALRFTLTEAAEFLNRTMALGLSAATVAALAGRTEGWITALQLAGLALRQQSDVEGFVAAFAGDDRYIVDYLVTEALDREPEPIRRFLRQTSILDRLTAPLCAALTGRDDAQAILEHLEQANLFLLSIDNRREWYRYHALFADVLRLSLSPAERLELHRKAAAWLATHGQEEAAMHHTRLAADLQPAMGQRSRAPAQALVEPLSERELDVLRLIAAGLSNAEIAQKLYVSLATVKTHINNIYGKLGVESRTQAVARARTCGLVE